MLISMPSGAITGSNRPPRSTSAFRNSSRGFRPGRRQVTDQVEKCMAIMNIADNDMRRDARALWMLTYVAIVLVVLSLCGPSVWAQEGLSELEAVIDESGAGLNPNDAEYAITMVRQRVGDLEATFRMLREG